MFLFLRLQHFVILYVCDRKACYKLNQTVKILIRLTFNSVSLHKNVDSSKVNVLADSIEMCLLKLCNLTFDKVENIVSPAFPLFSQCFRKAYFLESFITQNSVVHSQLSRTWKNRYRPILPRLFLYRIKKGLCGKTVITSSIFRIEDYLKWGEKI